MRGVAFRWSVFTRSDMAEALHDGRIDMFQAGHSAFLECPEAFTEGFLRFAGRIEPHEAQQSGPRLSPEPV